MIFSAPSGAGKTTIVKYLLTNRNNLSFSISATTRQPRGAEQDGKDYYFISETEFKQHIASNDFVEWEQVYSGSYYGTLKSEVERIWSEGNVVLFDVDVAGGLNLKKIFGENALAVFVMPPSLEVLEERLRKRGTETEEKIVERVAKAQSEMSFAPNFDQILLNDDLDTAKRDILQLADQFLQR